MARVDRDRFPATGGASHLPVGSTNFVVSRMGFGCRLRLMGNQAVALGTPGCHRVLARSIVSPIALCLATISEKQLVPIAHVHPFEYAIGGQESQWMESSSDRVALRAFPCSMPNKVYTLNSPRSLLKQQLLEDIMSLPPLSIPSLSRNVKEPLMVAIRKLEAMPSDPARYSLVDEVYIHSC